MDSVMTKESAHNFATKVGIFWAPILCRPRSNQRTKLIIRHRIDGLLLQGRTGVINGQQLEAMSPYYYGLIDCFISGVWHITCTYAGDRGTEVW